MKVTNPYSLPCILCPYFPPSTQYMVLANQHTINWLWFFLTCVVADKILDRILREIFLKLAVELCGKRFVVGNDEGRLLDSLDDICHGEGLSRARNP